MLKVLLTSKTCLLQQGIAQKLSIINVRSLELKAPQWVCFCRSDNGGQSCSAGMVSLGAIVWMRAFSAIATQGKTMLSHGERWTNAVKFELRSQLLRIKLSAGSVKSGYQTMLPRELQQSTVTDQNLFELWLQILNPEVTAEEVEKFCAAYDQDVAILLPQEVQLSSGFNAPTLSLQTTPIYTCTPNERSE